MSRDEEAESERDNLALYIIALADHIGDDRCEDKVVRNWLHILEQKCNIFVPYMENRSELRRHLYGVAELLLQDLAMRNQIHLVSCFRLD